MARVRMLLLMIAAMAAPAAAQPPTAPPPTVPPARRGEEAVIPPGMESLLGDMLGRAQALPGGCALTEGQIDRTTVRGTYRCQDGEVVLELLHPAAAPAGSVRTRQFAVAVRRGTAPPGVVDAVAERIRAREGEFTWKIIAGPRGEGAADLRSILLIAGVAIVAVLLLAAAVRALLRMRGRAGPT